MCFPRMSTTPKDKLLLISEVLFQGLVPLSAALRGLKFSADEVFLQRKRDGERNV